MSIRLGTHAFHHDVPRFHADSYITSTPNVVAVSSLTSAAGVATAITAVDHKLVDQSTVKIAGAGQAEYNGAVIVSVTGSNIFTYPIIGTPATPATGAITAKPVLPTDFFNAFLEYGKIDVEDEAVEPILESAVRTATLLTKREIFNKRFVTYRDCFPDGSHHHHHNQEIGNIQLRRSRFQSLERFEYFKDNTLTPVDSSIFYNTNDKDFSVLATFSDKSWPSDVDDRLQAIQIEFVAGYGNSIFDIPDDLVNAIFAHALNMYQNRGDCSACDSGNSSDDFLPIQSKLIYNNNRIMDIKVGG